MNEFSGEVIHGEGYEKKLPTANIKHGGVAPGVYLGKATLTGEDRKGLGRCLITVTPDNPVAEVYIADFRGNLYGVILSIHNLVPLSREDLIVLFDSLLQIQVPRIIDRAWYKKRAKKREE